MFYFLLYKAGQAVALLLPLTVGYRLACWLANLCYLFSRKSRSLVRYNLKIALGLNEVEVNNYVRATFRNFAKYLIDFFRFAKVDDEFIRKFVKVEGRENLDRALRSKKGVILVSAHLGNWELGAVVTALLGYPVHVIAFVHQNRRVNDFFVHQRTRKGVGVIPLGMAVKHTFDLLKENQAIAILGDRDFTQGGKDSEFFGETAQVPKGPATISLKAGSPIVPTFMLREPDDTFRFCFEPPIEYKPTGNMRKDLKNITKNYLGVIEGYIRRYPTQWYIFSQIWRESS